HGRGLRSDEPHRGYGPWPQGDPQHSARPPGAGFTRGGRHPPAQPVAATWSLRAGEENVVQRGGQFPVLLRRADGNAQVILDTLRLAEVANNDTALTQGSRQAGTGMASVTDEQKVRGGRQPLKTLPVQCR